MIERNIEETLDLCSMQVDGNYAGNTCSFQQVCHEFCGNRFTTASFTVLTSITIERNNSSDVVSASAFECICHNQQFHDVIVNFRSAGRLYDENILTTNTFINHNLDFAIVKTVNNRITNSSTQVSSNFAC